MPGPFPGMDPYLENPRYFHDFHQTFIPAIRRDLNAVLPPEYFAQIDEHLYVAPLDRTLGPDVAVYARDREQSPHREGTVATLEPIAPHFRLRVPDDELPGEAYIEIRRVNDPDVIVTFIELLSPSNKTGGPARQQYMEKQREVLSSTAHLMEIDLLRSGHHMFLPSQAAIEMAGGHWNYLISLHRSNRRGLFDCWRCTVRETLPVVPVPLDPGVPDVALDLQGVFQRTYDEAGYRRFLDYRQEPVPSLTGDDALWMDALLREKGLRS